MPATWNSKTTPWNSPFVCWDGVRRALWNDPAVGWNSKLFDWDGNPVLTEETKDHLHRDSVATHITEQAPVARITQQRLYARVADGH